jgi:hypothetical protein
MGYLGKRPATQGKDAGPALKLDDISSDFNGITTVFELTVNGTAVDPHINNIQVYLGGVHQIPGSSFSLSGSQIVFTGAPSSSLGFHGNVIGDSRLFIPDNDTVEPASFTANTRTHISGSFISGFNYSGTISGSSTSTASFGRLEVAGNTNLTGDIEFDDVTATGNIISTGTNKVISGSITSTGSFGRLQIDSTASFGRVITSTADINGGTIDGITSLTAGGDLDIGAHDLRASTLTADSLTATRVPFAGTDGVLSDDSDLTFATATLSATNLTSTGTIKDFASVSGSFVSTGSVGRIQTRTADIGIITGTSLTTSGNISASGDLNVNGNITGSSVSASIGKFTTVDIDGGTAVLSGGTITGNLSVGGTLTAQEVHTEFESASVLFTSGSTRFGNDTTDIHRVTGSMDISGSFKIPHGDVTITDTLTSTNIGAFNLTGKLTAGSTEIEGSAFDINGGTIDGITSLTAGGDLDIGAHDFRAATLTADGLTSGRVTFAGTNGVLSDDSDLTFATATLSATNLTTTGTIKNMALVSGSSVSTGSFGRIQTRTADVGIITGTSLTTSGNISGSVTSTGSFGGVFSAGVSRFDGDVGIGVSSPGGNLVVSSSTKTDLLVGDNSSVFSDTGRGNIEINGYGTATLGMTIDGAAKGLLFHDGTDSYFRNYANGQFQVFTNNTVRMTVSSSGEVGIGETAPIATLHIKEGDSGLTSLNGSGTNLFLEANGANAAGMTLASGTGANGFIIFADSDSNFRGAIQYDHSSPDKMHLTTSGSQRVTIDQHGFVGIGVTSPGYQLELRRNDTGTTPSLGIRQIGTGDASMAFQTTTSPYGFIIGVDASDSERFKIATGVSDVGGSPRFEIDPDGTTIHRYTGAENIVQIHSGVGSSTTGTSQIYFSSKDEHGGNTHQSYIKSTIDGTSSTSATKMTFHNRDSGGTVQEYMAIKADGLVQLNQNNVGSAGTTLKQLSLGTSNSTVIDFTNVGTMAGAIISNSHPDQNTGCGVIFTHRASSSGVSYITSRNEGSDASSLHFGTRGSAGVREELRITKDGNLEANDTSIGSLSDVRLKENIIEFTKGLELIKGLRAVTFKWKEGTRAYESGKTGTRRGLIAQEVLEVDDYWISEREIEDTAPGYEYVKDTGKEYVSKLNDKDAMYISAIKELSTEIENLKKQIEDLKN